MWVTAMSKTVRITIAGFGGQGVMMLGQVIAHAGARMNLNSLWYPSYGPETRGGTANCAVTVSTDAINSPVFARADVLFALNKPSFARFKEKVAPGGIILYNSSLISDADGGENVKAYGVPANDIATALGNIRVANMVMLGAYLALSSFFTEEVIEDVLRDFLGGKKEGMIAINAEAIKAGRRHIEEGKK
jgi:2-oxoglutarate ferredoxin oxidoreductase subunit gamma